MILLPLEINNILSESFCGEAEEIVLLTMAGLEILAMNLAEEFLQGQLPPG